MITPDKPKQYLWGTAHTLLHRQHNYWQYVDAYSQNICTYPVVLCFASKLKDKGPEDPCSDGHGQNDANEIHLYIRQDVVARNMLQ